MNSIKNTIVTVTLLAVGYGTYVVLSEPVPSEIAQGPTGVPWATTDEGAPGDWDSPEVEIPESTAAGQLTIPPDSELLETSEGQSDRDTDLPSSLTHAPDPLSIPSDQRTAPPESSDSVGGAVPPEMPPWTGDPSAPANGPADSLLAGPSNDASTAGPDEGYYARGSDPSAGSDYPQTEAVDFPAAIAPPATTETAVSPAAPPATGHVGFEETWKAVQTNLQNGQLAEALFALTVWYEEPSLSPDQTQRCIQLLDQLSGTVIYSRESFLEQAHVVQEGETLRSLAEQYNVPQEFLARINGIYPMNELAPGESLKVLRGPFRAEISRSRNEITVFLGRYYAGRFSARLGVELPEGDNVYEVVAKEDGREFFDRRTGERITRNDPRNPYGDRWIGLRGEKITAAHNVGIHVDVGSPDLCCIAVNHVDADDLRAILSVGSRVIVKP